MREELAAALHKAVRRLMWPEDRRFSVYHPAAVRVLRKVTAWLPDDAAAWYHLGVALDDAGEKEAAIEAYRKAIALDANLAYPWNGLGNVYRALGRYDEALEAYRKAIALDATIDALWYGLGLVYTSQGNLGQALEAFRKAVGLAPEVGVNHLALFGTLLRLGREDEARQEEAIARPLMAKEDEYNRACFAALCGEKDEALRLLQHALEKAPGLRLWARRDPDFQVLHDDPRFWELVGEDDGP